MTANAAVRLMAGFMLTLSLVLAHLVSPYFFLLTAFVGANLSQYAFTGSCPALSLFKAAGLQAEPKTTRMSVDGATSLAVGLVVLTSLIVTWVLGTPIPATVVIGVVALSLAQSAFTRWCPMIALVGRFGLAEGR